jgi:hypothetical protein
MNYKRPNYLLKKFLNNRYLLLFLNGILLTSSLYFLTESRYEKELFIAITRKIKEELPAQHNDYAFVQKALQTTSSLQDNRFRVFGNQQLEGIKANIFHPTTIDLMTNNGACGSYVTVLSRILKSNNIHVRIGQMKVNGNFGGHMIVEARVDGKWVVLDPTYSLYFTNADGSWASFKQLQSNWNYYKSQVPANYNMDYSFEDIRYTNWNKIPAITPAIKSILNVLLGKETADTISIRPYLLRNYHLLAWASFIAWLVVSLQLLKIYKQRRSNAKLLNEAEQEVKFKAS